MNGEIKQQVYDYLTRIPRGKVVTYGMIADFLGNPKMARAVGNILHANPDGAKYPCYKVVNSKGELAERYAFGGKQEQKRLLQNDGICIENDKVDLEKYLWKQ